MTVEVKLSKGPIEDRKEGSVKGTYSIHALQYTLYKNL